MTGFKLPPGLLEQHVIALGKTGSGKSSKLRVLVEGLLDAEEPVCIVDVKGDWWGLKSSADGKRAGYPVVIFGGNHADIPLNPHAGKDVADLIFTGNRPCIIDLRGWMPGDRTRFFIDFASTAFKVTRGKRYVVISEVHNFAPKGKVLSPQAGEMLHWANRLASEGRGLGLTLLADSQRPQKVHNDFLTSCETLIACKVIHKADRDAVKDWVDGCADPAVGREVIATLAQLKKPEAWVWSPEIEYGPERTTFPLFKTYDSFKPQEANTAKLKGWADVDLDEVKTKLQTVVAEAQANDPAALKKQIAELQRQIRATPAPVAAASQDELLAAQNLGYSAGFGDGQQRGWKDCADTIRPSLNALADFGRKILDNTEAAIKYSTATPKFEGATPAPVSVRFNKPPPKDTKFTVKYRAPALKRSNGYAPSGDAPTGARRRIMIALAQNHPEALTGRKLGILSGVKEGGSTWRAAMAQLRKDGHFAEDGDRFLLNEEGLQALGNYEPLPTGEDLRDYWRSQFGSTRLAVFNAILEGRGRPVPAARVAEAAGVELGGSTWRAHMAHLRGLELVTGSDQISASEDLF